MVITSSASELGLSSWRVGSLWPPLQSVDTGLQLILPRCPTISSQIGHHQNYIWADIVATQITLNQDSRTTWNLVCCAQWDRHWGSISERTNRQEWQKERVRLEVLYEWVTPKWALRLADKRGEAAVGISSLVLEYNFQMKTEWDSEIIMAQFTTNLINPVFYTKVGLYTAL